MQDMRGKKFCQRGSNSDNVFIFIFLIFLVDEGRESKETPLNIDHHQHASEAPFEWRFAGGPMMAQH